MKNSILNEDFVMVYSFYSKISNPSYHLTYRSLVETVKELKVKTFNNPLFLEYSETAVNEQTGEEFIKSEPLNEENTKVKFMTLSEYVECYGFLDEHTISKISNQIFSGLELLFHHSFFHGNLSINNVMIDQYSLNVKMANYGIYNCIYMENQLDTFEGSKMDLFCMGILILKLLGKLRLDMPLDLGRLQFKVEILKSIYKNESISYLLKSFLDKTFDEESSLSKILVHPFLTMVPDIGVNENHEGAFIKNNL